MGNSDSKITFIPDMTLLRVKKKKDRKKLNKIEGFYSIKTILLSEFINTFKFKHVYKNNPVEF